MSPWLYLNDSGGGGRVSNSGGGSGRVSDSSGGVGVEHGYLIIIIEWWMGRNGGGGGKINKKLYEMIIIWCP